MPQIDAMRRVILLLLIIGCATTALADDYRYWIGGGAGVVLPQANDQAEFMLGTELGGAVGHRLGGRWLIELNGAFLSSKEEDLLFAVPLDSLFPMGRARAKFEAIRIGARIDYLFRPASSRFNVSLGFGGGLYDWKIVDASQDTTFRIAGNRGQEVDYAASELFTSAGLKFYLFPSSKVSLQLAGNADYLTGAGAEFSQAVADTRGRWFLTGMLTLNIHFGGGTQRDEWSSDSSWQQPSAPSRPGKLASIDSDGDGVADESDRCLGTPRGIEVDRYGCPKDTDGDGVADGLDDCPTTEPAARGKIDIFGCPVDSDFDGVADYLDACPNNPVGAQVDQTGCPLDGDKDGVPDGLDDCPNTLAGIPVDRFGCMDLAMFSKPMTLHPDYEPGGFEIDSRTKARIESLARALALVPEIKLEIHAFTDDIGNDAANQKLSEKRANRIKDFLVVYGVSIDRITTAGRGETQFVASNQTAEGRAKNRRVEIIFHK